MTQFAVMQMRLRRGRSEPRENSTNSMQNGLRRCKLPQAILHFRPGCCCREILVSCTHTVRVGLFSSTLDTDHQSGRSVSIACQSQLTPSPKHRSGYVNSSRSQVQPESDESESHRESEMRQRFATAVSTFAMLAAIIGAQVKNTAESQESQKPERELPSGPKPLEALPEKLTRELDGATPLNPDGTVFIDVKSRRVVLRTEVACRDCVLEMFLVPEGNREHETILRIRSKAYVIHTALLALGLEPGKPAAFSPEFVSPSGPEIVLELVWLDSEGLVQRANARDWIRHNVHRYHSAPLSGPPPGLKLPYKNLRWDKFNNEILWYGPMTNEERTDLLSKWKKDEYQKAIMTFFEEGKSRPMTASFVFVGSSMYKDDETGEEFYQAEGGHVICTSNFPDALLDVREESSASDGGQTYEAWTERIPPVSTPVLLVMTPRAGAGKAALNSRNKDESTALANELPKDR